jgi:aspartyl-tRNA(Asn)/glutamyl-tRNA(Gln) amidotransferase subunit C
MASINEETIQNLITLSRIECTPEEQKKLLTDLAKIVAYVELLKEIDTENVTPCNHVLEGASNVMRDDVVGASMPRETFLANAPSQVGGMIRVPPVIKNH